MPVAPARRSAPREFAAGVATIMAKELLSRMRGRRAFVVLTLYLGLIAFIAYGVYAVVAPAARQAAGGFGELGFAQANASALIGQSIFAVLSILQLVLVSLVAPAFTAGQISLEREKQTLDLLVSTPLRPGAIVIGKLLTALAFVVLTIVAALPITAIVLMYGGPSIGDLVRQQVLLLTTAIGFGAVGIFASALTKRTQTATVVTYSVVVACILGSAMLYGFWNTLAARQDPFGINTSDRAPEVIRYVNPMVGMLDIVSAVEPAGGTALTRPLYEIFGADLGAGFVAVDGGDAPAFPGPIPGDGVVLDAEDGGHWWPRIALTFLIVAGVLTLASTRLVVPAGMRWAFRRRSEAASFDPIPVSALGDPGQPTVEEMEEAER